MASGLVRAGLAAAGLLLASPAEASDEWIRIAQAAPASQFDAALAATPVGDWLASVAGPKYRVEWAQGSCGRVRYPAPEAALRVCLAATWDSGPGSMFGYRVEVLFATQELAGRRSVRLWRVRYAGDLNANKWRELLKLSHVPGAMQMGTEYWQGVNRAGDAANRSIDEDRSEAFRFRWRCWIPGDGTAPLHWAARGGDLAAVRRLLAEGVDVDERWYQCSGNWHEAPVRGRTALMFAAEEGHVDVMRELMARGADPFALDNKLGDAWGHALHRRQDAALRFLVAELGERIPLTSRVLALNSVIQPGGSAAHVSYWLDQMPGIDPVRLEQPLVSAVQFEPEQARVLIERGAPMTGEVVAAAARSRRGLGSLALLLEAGASPDTRCASDMAGMDSADVTPLMAALDWSDATLEAVQLLVEHKANVNAVDANQRSVLDHALRRKDAAVIEFLKRAGAKPAGSR